MGVEGIYHICYTWMGVETENRPSTRPECIFIC